MGTKVNCVSVADNGQIPSVCLELFGLLKQLRIVDLCSGDFCVGTLFYNCHVKE